MKHWTLEQLFEYTVTVTKNAKGEYIPCQPENTKRDFLMLHERLSRAFDVFMCRADTFVWPETKDSK